ncbi:hypothetical protein COMNV_01498 [Commensalibacter sp. Nvir]|nr:hypothetical protein COMNV_01498 [Commensalibacter sp. Nvir]
MDKKIKEKTMNRFISFGLLLSFTMTLGLTLVGCGRKASPKPVGPPSKVTYPRSYPPAD